MTNTATTELDWNQIRHRLDTIWTEYEEGLEPSAEAALAVLQHRARDAAANVTPAPAGSAEEILQFTAGREPYGLGTRHIREICRITRMAPLPRAPKHLAGVTNLKGLILPLIDLDALMNGGDDCSDCSYSIVIGRAAPEFGVLAAALRGFIHLSADELLPIPRAVTNQAHHLARGLTAEGVLVLDDIRLLEDSRLYFGSATAR